MAVEITSRLGDMDQRLRCRGLRFSRGGRENRAQNHRTMNRGIICHISAIAVSVGIIAPNVYLLADRTPPFDLRDGSTVPSTLTPGGTYQFTWTIVPRRREHSCTGTVVWRIIDSEGVVWAQPATESLFALIKHNTPQRIVGRERVLPSGVANGPLRLESVISFTCNWTQHLWPIRVTFPAVITSVGR